MKDGLPNFEAEAGSRGYAETAPSQPAILLAIVVVGY
jgi:hypothetical protein